MGYKTFEKDNDIYFRYISKKKKTINSIYIKKKEPNNNPFSVLKNINFK